MIAGPAKRGAKRGLHALGTAALGAYGAWDWLRGPRPRLPFPPAAIRRVLVIRLDLLGDLVFSMPAIQALRGAFPGADVDLLVLPYTASAAARIAGVRTVHQLDVNRYRRPGGWRRADDLFRCVRALQAQHYDLAVGLSGLLGGVFAVLSGARWRLGYAAETYPGCYNLPVAGARYRRPQHEVDYCLDLVRALRPAAPRGARGPAPSDPSPLLAPAPRGPTPAPWPSAPYAVLVPGASNGAAKRWPARHWSILADRLAQERGLGIVLSGAPTERALAETVAAGARAPILNLAGATSVDDLERLLAGAALVVAGDTGPLHLATAVGTPAVGIYGPTDPLNTGPRGAHTAAVRLGLACSPCYDLRSPADCKLPDRSLPCMTGLTPDQVLEVLAEL